MAALRPPPQRQQKQHDKNKKEQRDNPLPYKEEK